MLQLKTGCGKGKVEVWPLWDSGLSLDHGPRLQTQMAKSIIFHTAVLH